MNGLYILQHDWTGNSAADAGTILLMPKDIKSWFVAGTPVICAPAGSARVDLSPTPNASRLAQADHRPRPSRQ